MDDAQLVQRAAERDEDAFALVYSRYAARLYDFVWWVVQDREEAAQALYETFLDAGARIHELQDGTKLRPWLFAIASRHALRRPAAPVDPATAAPPLADPSWSELTSATRSLAAQLGPRDRALLDLRFRQGLDGEELGDAIGVSSEEAMARVDRLTERVERALSLTAVAVLGQKDCAQLRALLGLWNGTLTGEQGETVERHTETCRICGPRRRKHIGASALLGVSPAPAVPPGVREHVLADVELASHRALPWSTRRNGFPRTAVAHPGRGLRAAVAVAAAVVLLGGVLLLTGDDDGPEEVASVDTTVARPTTTIRPATTAPSTSSTSTTSTSTPPGEGPGSGSGSGGSTATTARSTGGGAGGTGTGGTGGGGSGSGGGGAGGGAGGGGGGTGTTAPPGGDDPDPPPTDPPATTTTAPPDTTGPSLSGLSVSPATLRPSGACSNANATQATVTVQASDPSGVARVVATVAGPGGGQYSMAGSGGGTYSATIGPFESALPPPYELDVPVVVQATDGAGNSAATTGSLTLRCSA